MIKQGLQEIESEDAALIISFWREYLEENNLATIIPSDDMLHWYYEAVKFWFYYQ